MNRSRITLAITAIVAAAALATVAFAVPQQVMAYRHNHHNGNSIKVDQQVNQANQCSTIHQQEVLKKAFAAENATLALQQPQPQLHTICANLGSNSADIGH